MPLPKYDVFREHLVIMQGVFDIIFNS